MLERRSFLKSSTSVLGGIGLASLLNPQAFSETIAPHIAPRAKRVIYLFQGGGPPQHDLFDPKPHLNKVQGQDVPASVFGGQRLTDMSAGQTSFPVASSIFKFKKFGQCGMELNAELLGPPGAIADDTTA